MQHAHTAASHYPLSTGKALQEGKALRPPHTLAQSEQSSPAHACHSRGRHSNSACPVPHLPRHLPPVQGVWLEQGQP